MVLPCRAVRSSASVWRAFVGDPRLVVLDEPNPNLDIGGDKALANSIEHAKRNEIAVVFITRKPALLKSVDEIMLLANGTLNLFGARDTVLEQTSGKIAPRKPGGGQLT